jgi:hypothetical protein
MNKWLAGAVVVGMLFVGRVWAEDDPDTQYVQNETTIISATEFEFLYVSRYSLSDMQLKSPMLGVNLIPAKNKYVDFITLIGTEDNLLNNKVQWQIGVGVQTKFEQLDFSDDVANWLQSRLGITLPEGLELGPNLNPYGLVDPIETVKRFCNAIGDSTFKEEFNRDYFQNHTDGGLMIGFVKYTVTF